MASCASCGTPGIAPDRACPRCGAEPAGTGASPGPPTPELELDLRARPPPKPPKPRKSVEEDAPLELAVDPRALVQERALEARHGPAAPANVQAAASAQVVRGAAPGGYGRSATYHRGPVGHPPPGAPAVGDLEFDARVLADYGEPPRSWILAPLYAWRVLRRQRELKAVLAGRRAEAAHAAGELEDALVAFAERVRPAAEKQPGYATVLEELSRAEDLLRSRDRVLAAEQDAQTARLAQVDARLAKMEGELAQAQSDERTLAGELSSAQGALGREEAKLKRAEIELRSAQQREAGKAGG
ncbi:MAG TPA: hypothetical protein VIF15_09635 [Polyangiaceae bacterium]